MVEERREGGRDGGEKREGRGMEGKKGREEGQRGRKGGRERKGGRGRRWMREGRKERKRIKKPRTQDARQFHLHVHICYTCSQSFSCVAHKSRAVMYRHTIPSIVHTHTLT